VLTFLFIVKGLG